MQTWQDIEPGPYRFRNSYGQELDRTVISVTEKKVVYQRHEVEEGKLSDINPKRFIHFWNVAGIPYNPQFYGDRTAAFIDPDFEFDEDQVQLKL